MTTSVRERLDRPPSIVVSPRRAYWLTYLWLMPLAGFVMTAVIGGAASKAMGHDLTGQEIVTGWIIVTAALSVFAYNRDQSRPHFSFSDNLLTIGKGPSSVRIHESEIESIVVGLPKDIPWWQRLLKFHPAQKSLIANRQNSLLLRISGSRCVPLCTGHSFLTNGQEIMEAVLIANGLKIVSAKSYTDAEIRALKIPRWNRVSILRA
jgi:hypothetical protein